MESSRGSSESIERVTNGKIKTHEIDHDPVDLDEEHMVDFSNGSNKVPLRKVLHAYAGLARPGTYYAPARNLPSMAPAGLIGYGVHALFLGLILTNARGVHIPNFAVGTAWFSGGVGLLTAAIWEFLLENSWAGSVLGSFGLFNWSFAALYTPSFGVIETFGAYCAKHQDKMPEGLTVATWTEEMIAHAIGWWTISFIFMAFVALLTVIKSTVMFFMTIFCVFSLFVALSVGYLGDFTVSLQVAGGFVIGSGIFSIYNGVAGILTKENSYIHLKPIMLPGPASPLDKEEQM